MLLRVRMTGLPPTNSMSSIYRMSLVTRTLSSTRMSYFSTKSDESTDTASKPASESPSTAIPQDDPTAPLLVKIETLEKQSKEMKDAYLRALADAENLRERTRREKEAAQQLAIKSFASDLLNVADILEMALESVPKEERDSDNNPQLKSLYTGLTMTSAELGSTFKRHGIVPFSPVDQPFDPNMHQAMFQAPQPDKKPGTVFAVTKKGYLLHGIVIRAAQVGVVMDASQ